MSAEVSGRRRILVVADDVDAADERALSRLG